MPSISTKAWDHQTRLFTLTNARGNTVSLTNYGATVTSIVVESKEMILGFDDLSGYLGEQPYFGATIGRFGNRIAKGQFTLNGETWQLPVNNGPNCLHGGVQNFSHKHWTSKQNADEKEASVSFYLKSEDGDQGFPGELSTEVVFTWTNDNELKIEYFATTSKPTVVNLTNHAYFNISDAPTAEGLELELKASRYLPVDETSIPIGQLEPVVGSPFDFTTAKAVGKDLRANHPQIKIANGYDHTWVIDGEAGELREFALLTDPVSGRKLRVFTTEPGVQVFTANFEEGQFRERGGKPVLPYGAICLETQHFPDSPNQPGFPSTVLRPGERYTSVTIYRFEQ